MGDCEPNAPTIILSLCANAYLSKEEYKMDNKCLTRHSSKRGYLLLATFVILSLLTPYAAPATAIELAQLVSANNHSTNADAAIVLPRDETLYFNGQQWEAVSCWNPYSSGCNNAMSIAQQDNARVTVWERV